MAFQVLLYYQFVRIDDPEGYARQHLKWCRSLGLHGRIIIAAEGINGTVSGPSESTQAYMDGMHADPRFADMEFKVDPSERHTFRRLSVKARDEIITLDVDEELDPQKETGGYMEPKEWREAIQREDVIILDGRNDYESDLGKFRNAIAPPLESFRDFPEWIQENLSEHKDKTILTYCTGGIRCEKLSALMLKEGFKHVYQLHGGIIKYGQDPEVQGDLFDGKCYVFDDRISVPVNHTASATVITKCRHCGETCDRYINCANVLCNDQFFCCESCDEAHEHCCSDECREAEHHREPGKKLAK